MKYALAVIPLTLLVTACVSGGYKPVSDKLPTLSVAFADPQWTGKAIPSGQQCRLFGGKGDTPALKIDNIPAGANAIIVEYNDLSFAPLSTDGGHGKIGFRLNPGQTSLTIPALPGETATLPGNAFLEARARSSGQYASPGYLPPCSGGKGNTYVADVKAVYKGSKEGEEGRLYAQQRITLGTY